MYQDEYAATGVGAAAKVCLLKKNPLGYFLMSALAGAYIGFGILLSFTVGGTLGPIPMNKIAMGLSFGIALSLVIIAGAELFTGNAMVLYNGWRQKTVTLTDVIGLWIVCYLGNLVGASLIFYLLRRAWNGRRCRTGPGRSCRDQDEPAAVGPLPAGHLVQRPGLPRRLVRLPLQVRQRKIDHDFLVSLRLLYLRL